MREITKQKNFNSELPFYDHFSGLDMVINEIGELNIQERR